MSEIISVHEKAKEMWAKMDQNARTGVRFGLFPHAEMQAAIGDGFNGRDLSVALMDCAKKDGGMRA